MAETPYRAAIVGIGAIAGAHATALRAHADRASLTAVVDVDADRAVAFAGRREVPTVAPIRPRRDPADAVVGSPAG